MDTKNALYGWIFIWSFWPFFSFFIHFYLFIYFLCSFMFKEILFFLCSKWPENSYVVSHQYRNLLNLVGLSEDHPLNYGVKQECVCLFCFFKLSYVALESTLSLLSLKLGRTTRLIMFHFFHILHPLGSFAFSSSFVTWNHFLNCFWHIWLYRPKKPSTI